MIKRQAAGGRRITRELSARGYLRDPAGLKRERSGADARATAGLTRRTFLGQAAGAGLGLSLPLALASCGGTGDEEVAPGTERRTLFFNFAHEDFAGTEHFLVAGSNRYPLTKVKHAPEVLARARQTNQFLQAVPDDQITHHVENIPLATAICTLIYVGSHEDPVSGQWQMSSIVQVLPTAGAAVAFERATA